MYMAIIHKLYVRAIYAGMFTPLYTSPVSLRLGYETLNQCRFNVGPPSVVLVQHYTNSESTSRVGWERGRDPHIMKHQMSDYVFSNDEVCSCMNKITIHLCVNISIPQFDFASERMEFH